MTGPAKHYPQVRARDRIRAICKVCAAVDGDDCIWRRKKGVCTLDRALDALEAELRPRATPATQTKLGGI